MSDELDAILRRVAAGELSPEEAIPLIDAARPQAVPTPEWGTPPSTPPGTPGAPETPSASSEAPSSEAPSSEPPGSEPLGSDPGPGGQAKTVRIAVSYRSLDVIADPAVAEVAVSGNHSVRRQGSVLVVESLDLPGFSGLTEAGETATPGGSREERGFFAFAALPRSVAWAKAMKTEHLVVRVNPAMPVELDIAASGTRISGCEGGARIRLVASSLKVDRLRGPLDVDALTSSVKGTAAITGQSRIAAESASVKLTLLPGTDVLATATNRLGKVVLPTSASRPTTPPPMEAVIGSGSGRLTVDAVMSSVVLTLDAAAQKATA